MRLSDQTSDSLIELIMQENLKPGDKLPNEYELSQQLGVGRSTLREAVGSLKARNILEVRQGAGTYVSKNMGIHEDPLGFQFIKNTRELTKDLFTLRSILEPEVAILAAQNRKEEDLETLKSICTSIEQALEEDSDLHFELDIEFHSKIAKMSNNIAMIHLIPVINQSITLYNHYYTTEQSKVEMVESHREIYQAILEQDVVGARYAMQYHMLNIRKKLVRNKVK